MLMFFRFAPLGLRPTSPLRRLSSKQEVAPNTLAESLLIVFIPMRDLVREGAYRTSILFAHEADAFAHYLPNTGLLSVKL